MKQNIFLLSARWLPMVALIVLASCQKERDNLSPSAEEIPSVAGLQVNGHLQQTKTFSSEVALKWQDLQLNILRLPGSANPYGLNAVRYFAYTGIALYESVLPGMPSYQTLYGQLTNMPQMPITEPGKAYHWPTSANAALAYMNKHFYTTSNTAAHFLVSMDSLENALNNQYQSEVNSATFQRSLAFGRTVAERVFTWSTTDGALTPPPPYINAALPLWQPTAPNPTGVVGPTWGNNRSFVQGSAAGAVPPSPPVYSTDPNSAYYAMVKEVYDVWQNLTEEQKTTARYFYDRPGFPSGTHYINIFSQVMHRELPQLDFYAVAQAKTGIALAETMINCWKIKYQVLLDRPIRYIRTVLGHSTWSPYMDTPGHPDFPSGHSQVGGSFATVFNSLFGEDYPITLHTYDYLGYAPRSYASFNAMVEEIGRSRVYAGIHYSFSCVEGRKQGQKIATNVLNILKFKKD